MITEKLMEKPWILWRLWNAFVSNGLSMGGAVTDTAVGAVMYESITHAALVDLITAEDLVPGKQYLISDFETTFTLNISGNPYTDASVESIIVTALTDASLEPIAYSISHPKDILYYDVDGTTYMPGSTKGCIYRRIDTEKNISVPFDFREFKVEVGYDENECPAWTDVPSYNRGQIVEEAGTLYMSKKGTNNDNAVSDATWWQNMGAVADLKTLKVFTFFGNTIGVAGTVSSPSLTFDIVSSYNFVINQQPTTISESLFLTYGYVKNCTFDALDNCHFNTEDDIVNCHGGVIKDYILTSGSFTNNNLAGVEGLITGTFNNNTISKGFNNNFIASASGNNVGSDAIDNIIDGSFLNNNIDARFQNNNIGLQCEDNNIGHDCSNNTISINFRNNNIGLRFQLNTLASNFGRDNDEGVNHGNTIGNDFQGNTTLGNAFGNHIGNFCNANTWGAVFMNNHLGNKFYSNTCGTNFQDNKLPFDFYSNTTGDNFQNWIGQVSVNGKDFSALTLPASNVGKYIIRDAFDGLSWAYWNLSMFAIAPL